MKVLIIEDEHPAQLKLERFLGEIDNTIEVIAKLASVEESTNWITQNPAPDLIFMDIRLEDGTCFEIFENVNIKTPVIFTTAYDEYAIRAFKVNSVDYLLKPLDFDELKSAVEKYKSIHLKSLNTFGFGNLISTMQSTPKERFLIKVGGHYKSVQVDDICYFFIEERNNFIMVKQAKIYAIDYSLDQIEQMVDSNRFFRINRGCIVNIKSILDIIEYSSSRLKLKIEHQKVGEEILVSRERVKDFKKWMDR